MRLSRSSGLLFRVVEVGRTKTSVEMEIRLTWLGRALCWMARRVAEGQDDGAPHR